MKDFDRIISKLNKIIQAMEELKQYAEDFQNNVKSFNPFNDSCLGSAPGHLKEFDWYLPHQAWLREKGYNHHDPEDAIAKCSSLPYCSFDGRDFTNGIFSYGNFDDCVFSNTLMENCDFANCSFRNSKFSNHVAKKSEFSYADFNACKFSEADFLNCSFCEVILDNSNFCQCNFKESFFGVTDFT